MFSRVAYLSTLALVWTALLAAHAQLSNSTSDWTSLFAPSLSLGAEIFLPTDANYTEEVTQRWTIHEAPSYLGAIKVATEADVEATVRGNISSYLPQGTS
jgi:fumiquinazoline A oxidase